MNSEVLWIELETEAQRIAGSGILKRMIAPESVCTIFLGVQQPSLNRLFLLQAPRNLLPSREQLLESRGFELTVQLTGEEPDTHATFVLRATDRAFNEIFSAMTEDLYRSLIECRDNRQIVHTFMDRLLQWQEFFERNGPGGISEEAQRGLYGELYFLRRVLLSTPENYTAEVASWTGPKSRQHDFQFGDAAVEVKSSIAKQHQKLLISSEQQLDETLVGSLFLYHLSLSCVESNSNTLPALVADLRNILYVAYDAASVFENILVKTGYLDVQAWRYEKTGYIVRESNLFHVAGDFPRLAERDLPAGVGDLSYSISISECKRFAVPHKELIERIRRGI